MLTQLQNISNISFKIDNNSLDRCHKFKYLGVVINENLSWSDHIDSIKTKINQRLGLLRRLKPFITNSTVKMLYFSLVLPIFDYGDIIWGDKNNKTLMASLQILQNKAAKIILDEPLHSSATEALEKLKWKSLDRRRRYHRCILVFKSLHGLMDMNIPFNQVSHRSWFSE